MYKDLAQKYAKKKGDRIHEHNGKIYVFYGNSNKPQVYDSYKDVCEDWYYDEHFNSLSN